MVQQRSQKHYLEFISSIPSLMVEQCHGNIVNRLCSSFMSGPQFLCFILGHTPPCRLALCVQPFLLHFFTTYVGLWWDKGVVVIKVKVGVQFTGTQKTMITLEPRQGSRIKLSLVGVKVI